MGLLINTRSRDREDYVEPKISKDGPGGRDEEHIQSVYLSHLTSRYDPVTNTYC